MRHDDSRCPCCACLLDPRPSQCASYCACCDYTWAWEAVPVGAFERALHAEIDKAEREIRDYAKKPPTYYGVGGF